MTRLRHIADRLIGLSAIFGSLALLAEVIVILVDVIGRAFGYPLLGSQDIVTMVMVIVVFGAMAVCDRRNGNITIDIFEAWFPGWFNRFADILSALIGAAIFFMIAWTVYESAKLSVMLNLSTNLLEWPKAWFQWALCGFAVLTGLGMLLRAVELTFTRRNIFREDQF